MTDWNTKIIEEFRANGGKVGGPFEGATLVLLHTTGAKSGEERTAGSAFGSKNGGCRMPAGKVIWFDSGL